MAREWLVRRGTKVVGPVSDGKLAALAIAGKLLSEDDVSPDGGKQWIAAGSLKGLVFKSNLDQQSPAEREVLGGDASQSQHQDSVAVSEPQWYVKGGCKSLRTGGEEIKLVREAIKFRAMAMSLAGVSLIVPVLHLVSIPLGVLCLSRHKEALSNPKKLSRPWMPLRRCRRRRLPESPGRNGMWSQALWRKW